MRYPGPVRAFVGLAATAAAEVRRLPDRAIELPMLAVSTALQASLRAQQRYAQLATRGGEVLQHRAPPSDPPPWARFDDDPGAADPGTSASFETARSSVSSALGDLLGTDDPIASPHDPEPIDEIPTPDEPAPAPVRNAARPAAKKAPTKKAVAKSPATSAAKSPARKAAPKTVSPPRHTGPSAFDRADSDRADAPDDDPAASADPTD